jgi:hypothetical protein
MAWLSIRVAEVTNTFFDGKGASVKESFTKNDGTEGAQYFSAFFTAPHGLNVGDVVKIGGIQSVKTEEYEGVVRAKVTINNAQVEVLSSAEPVATPSGNPF